MSAVVQLLYEPYPMEDDMTICHFWKQKYASIEKACIDRKTLFKDPLFPASEQSLMISRLNSDVEWKRPHEICENPKFVKDDVNRLCAIQGILANYWFIAAISALASRPLLWNKVVPDAEHQELSPNKRSYTGVFHFTLFHFGKWVDVVVDDRLPTVNNRLIFTRSQSGDEFCCALLEKAYAKLWGSYKNLENGYLAEVLIDLTGGFLETVELREYVKENKEHSKVKRHIFKTITSDLESHSLVFCAIKALPPTEMQKRTKMGFVKDHAYYVTGVQQIRISDTGLLKSSKERKINMIRLKNPWGQSEWTGAYSIDSPQWKKFTENERKKMGLSLENGEFWMTFDDFCTYITTLTICHLKRTSFMLYHGDDDIHSYDIHSYEWMTTTGPSYIDISIDYTDDGLSSTADSGVVKNDANNHSLIIGLTVVGAICGIAALILIDICWICRNIFLRKLIL